jgi:hypothetical protein
MDFVERWFGVSPDAGSGGLEIALIIMALVVLAAPVVGRFRSMARMAWSKRNAA